MQCDHLFEFLTKLSVIANKQSAIKVVQGRWVCVYHRTEEVGFDTCHDIKHLCVFVLILSIKIEIQAGKESAVDFSTGQEPMVYKGKNGHLMVVRWVLLWWRVSSLLCSKVNLHSKKGQATWIELFCHCRLPLGPGHGNVCGVEKTHKMPLHISSGDPWGEINMSTGNTPDQKQQHFRNPGWACFVVKLIFHLYIHTSQ